MGFGGYNPAQYAQMKSQAVQGVTSGVQQGLGQIAQGVEGAVKEQKKKRSELTEALEARNVLTRLMRTAETVDPEVSSGIRGMGFRSVNDVVPPPPKKGVSLNSYLKKVNDGIDSLASALALNPNVTEKMLDDAMKLPGWSKSARDMLGVAKVAAKEERGRQKEAGKEQQQQALGQASQQAVGAQFQEQAPSTQLQGALGTQAPAKPEVPPHQTPGGPADREASLQPQGGPMQGGPSMVTQGEAQTRPEAQQRVGQALGNIGAPPEDIQKQQQIAGAGLPQQAPGPDDALMRDVEAKGGLSKPLGANTFIVGKTEQLGQAESKAKNIKKLITQITKDPQLMSNPEKRMKFVADAKPLGLWDDETGPASNEMMAEMLTAAEEHAEQIKGEIKEAEAEKKMAVLGKPKTTTPKMATPMSASAAEAKLNNEVNKRLKMMFPNDVEEILHPYTKAVTGYRVLPNSKASQMISTPNKFAKFAQQYFPQLSKSAQVRGGAPAPASSRFKVEVMP